MSNNPKIIVRSNNSLGTELANNGSMQLGEFVANTTAKFYLFIGNNSVDSLLTISFNGITSSGQAVLSAVYDSVVVDGILEKNSIINLPVSLVFQKGIFVEINLNTELTGNQSFTIGIKSNDINTATFKQTFYFTVTAASTVSSNIALIYNTQQITNGGIVNLGSVSQNSTRKVSFIITNYGVPTLEIPQNGISITGIVGSSSFDSNPSSAGGLSLSFNTTSIFTINLDTLSIGTNSFVISISNNDSGDNPFSFTAIYTNAQAYNLVVEENSAEVNDGQIMYLGSVAQNTVITKNITMSNSGILYGIRVTNIVSEGNVTFLQIPALPFILEPNESNYFSVICRIGTNNLGQKTGAANIQWEVAL